VHPPGLPRLSPTVADVVRRAKALAARLQTEQPDEFAVPVDDGQAPPCRPAHERGHRDERHVRRDRAARQGPDGAGRTSVEACGREILALDGRDEACPVAEKRHVHVIVAKERTQVSNVHRHGMNRGIGEHRIAHGGERRQQIAT